jgi:secretion/DNA translocation related TadE-like protein
MQHHVDGAAELAALAAAEAGRTPQGGVCDAASDSAQRNGAALVSCRVDGADVVVTVTGQIDLPWGIDGTLTSTARAGP